MEIFNDLGLGLIHISDSKFVNPIQRMDSLICLQLFRAAIKTNLSKLAGCLDGERKKNRTRKSNIWKPAAQQSIMLAANTHFRLRICWEMWEYLISVRSLVLHSLAVLAIALISIPFLVSWIQKCYLPDRYISPAWYWQEPTDLIGIWTIFIMRQWNRVFRRTQTPTDLPI